MQEIDFSSGFTSNKSMQRICIVGTSGSGKTTVAKKAAKNLGYSHIELDSLHWEPNWTEAPLQVFRDQVSMVTQDNQWIVDGNYSKVRDIVWERADTVVWLDYSFLTIFMRLLWRTLRRGIFREELWNENKESLAMAFSKDSILLWAITSHPKRKTEYPKLMLDDKYRHINFIRHASPKETEMWLKSLSS
jgi:adenylate kinase family enzyme